METTLTSQSQPPLSRKRPPTLIHREKIFFTKPLNFPSSPTSPLPVTGRPILQRKNHQHSLNRNVQVQIQNYNKENVPQNVYLVPDYGKVLNTSLSSPRITRRCGNLLDDALTKSVLLHTNDLPKKENLKVLLSPQHEERVSILEKVGNIPPLKKENLKVLLSPQEEERISSLEKAGKPSIRRQNTKPLLSDEDRERISTHAQKVLERENRSYLRRTSSDSELLEFNNNNALKDAELEKLTHTNHPKKVKNRVLDFKENDRPGKSSDLDFEVMSEKKRRSSRWILNHRRATSPQSLSMSRRKSLESPATIFSLNHKPEKRRTSPRIILRQFDLDGNGRTPHIGTGFIKKPRDISTPPSSKFPKKHSTIIKSRDYENTKPKQVQLERTPLNLCNDPLSVVNPSPLYKRSPLLQHNIISKDLSQSTYHKSLPPPKIFSENTINSNVKSKSTNNKHRRDRHRMTAPRPITKDIDTETPGSKDKYRSYSYENINRYTPIITPKQKTLEEKE